jgi:hypothetical protein
LIISQKILPSSLSRVSLHKFSARELFSAIAVALGIFLSIVMDMLPYLLAGVGAVVIAVLFVKDSRVRFVLVFGLVVLLSLKTEHGTFSPLDYAAAAVFTGSFLYIIIKRKLIQAGPVSPSPAFMWYNVYLLWGFFIGLIGVVSGVVQVESWLRDTLLFISPLFLLPVFFAEIAEEFPHPERVLGVCIIALWIVVFSFSLLKIRSNVVSAYYYYQIGNARYDDVNSSFMLYLFVSLAMLGIPKYRFWILCGALLSLIGLLVTFGRMAWVVDVILIPLMVLVGSRQDRKNGIKFLTLFISTVVLGAVLAFFVLPLFKAFALIAADKFVSAGNIRTDPSLYNRYVEWRYAWKDISSVPLTSHGFGSSFWDYDWLRGKFLFTTFTHSAALLTILKSGIVGLIILIIPLISYFLKGIRYLRNKFVTPFEKALLRAGIVTMIFVGLIGYTTALFTQRSIVMYIALYWCYIIALEMKVNKRIIISKEKILST